MWTAEDAGALEEPSLKSPLTIFINQDMDLLTSYRDRLVAKKNSETTIQGRINKYTTHVAFHLYQIYLKQKEFRSNPEITGETLTELQMRDEVQRVARTLIKLMEVAQ